MKILDSDHCVALLRGRLDLQGHGEPDDILAVTTVGVGELCHGAHKSSRPEQNLARLDYLLTRLAILPYDESSARWFGQIKARLEQTGERLDDIDIQIASIALANEFVLVTHNIGHFGRLARTEGLKLDDGL